jgi:hypothetical protein
MSVTTPTKQSAFDVEQGMDRSLWIEHQLSVSFDGQDWTLCSRTSPDVSRIISPLAAQTLMSLWTLWVKQIEDEDLEFEG